MLVIEALDGATVERAGALVACEQAAARRVRPELPTAFDSPDVCTATLQRLCDSVNVELVPRERVVTQIGLICMRLAAVSGLAAVRGVLILSS